MKYTAPMSEQPMSEENTIITCLKKYGVLLASDIAKIEVEQHLKPKPHSDLWIVSCKKSDEPLKERYMILQDDSIGRNTRFLISQFESVMDKPYGHLVSNDGSVLDGERYAVRYNEHTYYLWHLKEKRNVRLDQWVTELFPLMSRAHAAKLVSQGKVTVNDKIQAKPGYKLRRDDQVMVDYDESELTNIPDIELPVLYEDDNVVVIDKPVGVLTHSVGAYTAEGTVATWLRHRLQDIKEPRGGIVHRLDRVTSGVMICAKTPQALVYLQKQFADRTVRKTYVAVVLGTMKLRSDHRHANRAKS